MILKQEFNHSGFALIPKLFTPEELQPLLAEIEQSKDLIPKAGLRQTNKKLISSQELILSNQVKETCANILGEDTQLVRAILFDKSPEQNWGVLWHQDKTISVDNKVAIGDWGSRSIKDGKHHVQPPLAVLKQMLTLRIHLDPCMKENGCLKLIPNSHKLGIMTQEEIKDLVSRKTSLDCEAGIGDTLIMRPHIVHSSNKMTKGEHRRILHLEFSSFNLPDNLNWIP